MKKGKRVKPRFPIEYRVLITPQYKEREKEIITLVALRTVNEFTNFKYEIVVQPVLEDHVLKLNIHGLRAPQVTIPGTGPAIFETEMSNLHGVYTVVVSKLDREENTFTVNITNERVTVEKSPRDRFVDIVTSELDW